MNIDGLQPGPELDTLVAERVVGWRVRGKNNGPRIAHRFVEETSLDSAYPRMWLDGDGMLTGWALDEWPEGAFDEHSPYYAGDAPALFTPYGVFRPSVDWATAGLVVEKMSLGFAFSMFKPPLLSSDDFIVIFDKRHRPASQDCFGLLPSAKAETAPLAICRAALKAVGGLDKS